MSTELEKRQIHRFSNKESNRITKECICSAMISLMNEYPYESINMTMIINRSGASRASVYRNYPSKDSIMVDITQNLTDELNSSLSEALHNKNNPREWFLEVFERLHADKDMCILAQKANLPFVDLFYNALGKASDNSYIPQKEYQARGIAAGLWEIVITWIKNGMKETPEEMADNCIATFTSGMNSR